MDELIPGLHIPSEEPLAEDRFTAPTELCPHPGRWTSTDGDSTEVEVSHLIAALVVALQPDVVVETGSAFGQTTEFIGRALLANGRGHLTSLDPDPDRIAYTARRCEGLPVTLLEQTAESFTPTEEIQLLFLDSLYSTRLPELHHFRPHLRVGSIVVVHDTAPGHGAGNFEEGRDLRDELNASGYACIHLPTPRGVSLLEVR